jgi:glycosyltransferase involved in cell wall biosynthesis
MAENLLRDLDGSYDFIYQDGAMFMPGMNTRRHYASYHDCNVILAAGGGALTQGAHYKGIALDKAIERERTVYQGASVVFTMSEWLKMSLVKDFGIPEEKIITVYAGTNIQPQHFEKIFDGKTILFVGKNFERKGGQILLKAFEVVRKEIPDAKLIIIGPRLNLNANGIFVLGPVNDSKVLSKYFREASVFVLPSRFEPFGIVFAEAFTHKTPCIGSDICAMPEIIEEGKGGYVVPPDDHVILAKRIIELLKNERLARQMGEFGFKKALEIFNWDVIIEKMVAHLTKLRK